MHNFFYKTGSEDDLEKKILLELQDKGPRNNEDRERALRKRVTSKDPSSRKVMHKT